MTTRESYFDGQHLEVWLGGRPVFTDLSLQLNRGEHTVVLGPNGSGKSSLIKLLTRELYPVVKPASSLRLFGDTTVNLWELRRRIGHVSADLQTTYSPVVTAADVVLSGLFGSVGIGRSQPATQRQRRQALELMEQQLLGWLSRLASSGTTLLLVTHQIEAIIPEIQRAVLLRNGTVMAEGSADQWLQSAPLSTLFATPLQLVESGGWRQLLPAAEPGIDGRVAPQTPGLPVG